MSFHRQSVATHQTIQWRVQQEFEGMMRPLHYNELFDCPEKEVQYVRHLGSADRIRHVLQFGNLDPSEREVLHSWSECPQESHGSHVSSSVACLPAVTPLEAGQL